MKILIVDDQLPNRLIAKFLVDNNIQVMGHIGLTPQTAKEFKVQGKDEETANKLIKLAKECDDAGCFSLVLECVPLDLAKKIAFLERLKASPALFITSLRSLE